MIKRAVLSFMQFPAHQGFWQRLMHTSKIGMNYWNTEVHSSGELHLLKKVKEWNLNKNILVFDVGANQGQFANYFKKEFGDKCTIYSFEPSSKTFDKLKANTTE